MDEEHTEFAIEAGVEGYHARRDDVPRGDNPHAVGTSLHRHWRFGWDMEDKLIQRAEGQ
ncbi:hypothetical protein LCGC14_0354930 [marine sediment metagenome]|uniref:Uncharacterized protein n=1 Tax=marine sediment metagenome TaxID=412755 RepID=A0A0F9WHR3_9ZZZZ